MGVGDQLLDHQALARGQTGAQHHAAALGRIDEGRGGDVALDQPVGLDTGHAHGAGCGLLGQGRIQAPGLAQAGVQPRAVASAQPRIVALGHRLAAAGDPRAHRHRAVIVERGQPQAQRQHRLAVQRQHPLGDHRQPRPAGRAPDGAARRAAGGQVQGLFEFDDLAQRRAARQGDRHLGGAGHRHAGV